MKEFHGQASMTVESAPEQVFELVTDLDRLPRWNTAIAELIDRPEAVTVGSEWTVKMKPPRMPSWGSISRVTELDLDGLRFVYETRNADGNPSSVTWQWQVEPADDGARVTVSWDCYLRTADRRLLAGPMRKRQLAREVPGSLTAMAKALLAPSEP
jgi:uncharacterized protein YndB with AHSA1/START domain